MTCVDMSVSLSACVISKTVFYSIGCWREGDVENKFEVLVRIGVL
jgi:hypothetical protein